MYGVSPNALYHAKQKGSQMIHHWAGRATCHFYLYGSLILLMGLPWPSNTVPLILGLGAAWFLHYPRRAAS